MNMSTVEDVMEKHPVSITGDDFMTHARQLMRDHHFRTLPVIDWKKKVMGIITEQDVLNITSTKSNITVKGYINETPVITSDMNLRQTAEIMIEAGITCTPVLESTDNRTLSGIISIVDIFNSMDLSNIQDCTVSDFMSGNVIACSPDDSIANIWMNMINKGYSGYPVLDKHKHPIGMVTRHDIIKSGRIRIKREDEHGTHIETSSTVARIMRTPALTITPDAPLKDAIEMMIRLDVGRLCVVDRDRLVGIIDRHDMVRAYANMR